MVVSSAGSPTLKVPAVVDCAEADLALIEAAARLDPASRPNLRRFILFCFLILFIIGAAAGILSSGHFIRAGRLFHGQIVVCGRCVIFGLCRISRRRAATAIEGADGGRT